jgi:m7GpppX diphosphatase
MRNYAFNSPIFYRMPVYRFQNKISTRLLLEESPEKFFSPEMQRYIEDRRQDPSKRWVEDIINGSKESEFIRVKNHDYILLPDTDKLNRGKDIVNWLVLFTDPTLRCIRDLRGEHVSLLKNMITDVRKVMSSEHGVPPEQIMIYAHYHPTVYQLHFHVAYPYAQPNQRDVFRIHSVQSIISNLEIDGNYYKKARIIVPAPITSGVAPVLCSLSYSAVVKKGMLRQAVS